MSTRVQDGEEWAVLPIDRTALGRGAEMRHLSRTVCLVPTLISAVADVNAEEGQIVPLPGPASISDHPSFP